MSNYYVYVHFEPDYELEIVYVGKGKYGRAWDVTRNRKYNSEHFEWMEELYELGYLPTDWTKIIHRGLSEKDAFDIEKAYMHNNGAPVFNKNAGQYNHQAKLTNEQAREAYRLAKSGMLHQEIADLYGVGRSTISMIACGNQWKAATADLRREL